MIFPSRTRFVFASLLSLYGAAHADEAAYYCHADKREQVVVTRREGACTGFDWHDGSDSAHVDFGAHISGRVLISDDGRNVAVLQTDLYGGMRADGSMFAYGERTDDDPIAVALYHDRQLVGSYRFSQILQRPRMVELSVSHLHWLRKVDGFEASHGKALVLETTSLRTITFDVEGGKISDARDSDDWNRCDTIVYGPVARVDARGEMGQPYFAKGEPADALTFAIPATLNIIGGGQYQALCLKRTPSGLAAVAVIPILFNGLTLAPPAAKHEDAAPKPARTPHFTIELYLIGGGDAEWELRIKPDIAMQTLDARVRGDEKWNYGTFTSPGGDWMDGWAYVRIAHLKPRATLEIRGKDGSGNEVSASQAFDTQVAIPTFLRHELQHVRTRWVEIDTMSQGSYLMFNTLVDARCTLREIRYSMDSRELDARFPVPDCDIADPRGGDPKLFIPLDSPPAYVAVQLVFSNGELSPIRIFRRGEQ